MERTIAVEGGLGPIKELLQEKGYKVVDIRTNRQVDAAVITGMDKSFMDMQTVKIDAPVIDASGKTPKEVLREIEDKLLH